MSLIKCSECSKEVSENATACPYCGNPLKVAEVKVSTEPNKRVEIELTSKKWKKVILFSWIAIVVLLILFYSSKNYVWFGLLIISIFVLIAGKIGAWYSNK